MPTTKERVPCPKCGKVGLPVYDEWYCFNGGHGTYGITLYGWDSLGRNGGIDAEEARKDGGLSFNRASHIPSPHWLPREIHAMQTWQEGDPIEEWAR